MAHTRFGRFVRYAVADAEHLSRVRSQPSLQFAGPDRMQESSGVRDGAQTIGSETDMPRKKFGNFFNLSDASGGQNALLEAI